MEKLKTYISGFGFLTPEEYHEIFCHVTIRNYAKGEYFLKAGMIAEKIGFITNGLVRYFEDEEHTKYFAKEDDFITELESFNGRTPSTDSIQAVTDCRIIYFSRESFHASMASVPAFVPIVQRITESCLLKKLNHKAPFLIQDASTRYENFLRDHPDICMRAPLGYIASYLGITPQSLSRIRKNLVRQ